MRVVFMGSPEFAVPALRALLEHHDVTLVITQPDKPAGRGKKLTPPPVKRVAEEAGVPIYQPRSARTPEFLERLTAAAFVPIGGAGTLHGVLAALSRQPLPLDLAAVYPQKDAARFRIGGDKVRLGVPARDERRAELARERVGEHVRDRVRQLHRLDGERAGADLVAWPHILE